MLYDKNDKKSNENVSDNRQSVDEIFKDFTIVDNDFLRSGFDPYTVSYYLHIVMRARFSERGCDEYKETSADATKISVAHIKRCRSLLEFCNIIRIIQRKDPKNPKMNLSSKIILVDKKNWNIKHDHRDAGEFSKKENITPRLHQNLPPSAPAKPTPRLQESHRTKSPLNKKREDTGESATPPSLSKFPKDKEIVYELADLVSNVKGSRYENSDSKLTIKQLMKEGITSEQISGAIEFLQAFKGQWIKKDEISNLLPQKLLYVINNQERIKEEYEEKRRSKTTPQVAPIPPCAAAPSMTMEERAALADALGGSW